ncbi:MAG: hypothetical protein ACRCYQ_17220 [Nocardioides sp.]
MASATSFSDRASAKLSASIATCVDDLALVRAELSATVVTAQQAGDRRAAAAINGVSDSAAAAVAGVGAKIDHLPAGVRRIYAALAVADDEAARGLGRAASSLDPR